MKYVIFKKKKRGDVARGSSTVEGHVLCNEEVPDQDLERSLPETQGISCQGAQYRLSAFNLLHAAAGLPMLSTDQNPSSLPIAEESIEFKEGCLIYIKYLTQQFSDPAPIRLQVKLLGCLCP